MRKIIARYIVILLVIISVSNFSFAATTGEIAAEQAYCQTQTSICGTAPAEFTALTDFVREMMNSIKTIGTEWTYVGKYVDPNRFNGNTFAPPKQNIISKLARNVDQKLKFGLASATILVDPANIGGVKDIAGWTTLLFRNKVFLRDTKLVNDLEALLATKKLELWLWAWRYEKVNSENLKIMQTILKKYIDKWVLTDASQLKDWVLYNNITSMLTSILSSLKAFLSFGSTSQLDAISRGWGNGIFIVFNQKAITTIDRNYACVWSPNTICSTQSKKISQMLTILKNSVSVAKAAGKTFTDAIKRLWQTFAPSQQDDQFRTRENDLLRSMYGTTKFSTGRLINISVKESNGSIKDVAQAAGALWKWVIDAWIWVADGLTTVAKYFFTPKTLKETVDYTQAPSSSNSPASYNSWENAFTSLMSTYISDVFASQKADSELADFVEVKKITPAFKVLSDQIHSLENDVLGGKDKESSLIRSLWKACELQCGGGGKCR